MADNNFDLASDKTFQGWDDNTRHAYLADTNADYKSMAPEHQRSYLGYLRGQQESLKPEHPWVRANRFAQAGVEDPGPAKPPTARKAAVEGGAMVGTLATGGLGPVAGAAVRTGITALEPYLAGEERPGKKAMERGALNLGIESLFPAGGKLIRSAPGVEGRQLAKIEAERKGREVSARMAHDADVGAVADTYDAAKKMAKGTADSMHGANTNAWQAKVNEIKTQHAADTDAVQLADSRRRAEPIVNTMNEQVPIAGVKDRESAHNFAWGEKGWDPIKKAMDEGEQNVHRHLKGRTLRLPELAEPGEASMTFPQAWARVSALRGAERRQGMEALKGEIARNDPSGQAQAVFEDLQKLYSNAKTWQAAAQKGFPASGGGELDPNGLISWWNKRRPQLEGRMRGDYDSAANAVYGDVPRGGSYTPPEVPRPQLPARPARPGSDIGPRPEPPAFVPPEPSATVESLSPLQKFLLKPAGKATFLLPNLFSRWSGRVPFKPSSTTRTLADYFGQAALNPHQSRTPGFK